MAFCNHTFWWHHQRGAQLRLRLVRAEDYARATRLARPEQLEGGIQRRGARSGGDDRALCRGIRAVRFPSRGLFSLLRPGRGDLDRIGRVCRRGPRGPLVRRCRDRRQASHPTPARRRGIPEIGWVWPDGGRSGDCDRRSRDAHNLPRRADWGGLGERSQRGPGILAAT